MKRNSLTTAVVAGIAGVAGFAGLANAVDLNPDGLGQVLIYPYYTVNKSQDTLFSVVNTDPVNGKAVKVRFLEGYNSREVLDFNLLPVAERRVDGRGQPDCRRRRWRRGQHDRPELHAIRRDPAGSVVRSLPHGSHSTARGPVPADDGPQDITRTREGYIEMISMGDIAPGSALTALITHVQNGSRPAVLAGLLQWHARR